MRLFVSPSSSASPSSLTSKPRTAAADRLRTIITFNKVLVLDHGVVLEYDTPAALLSRDDSAFSALCRKSGELDILKEMARKAESERVTEAGPSRVQ